METDSLHPLHPEPLTCSLERLYLRQTFGVKPGLEPIGKLCKQIGNPQEKFAVVHVAGTNGKGSVCAMIESVLRQTGLRTGLYTSPHMVRFNERIRIGGQETDDKELTAVLNLCEEAATGLAPSLNHEATFFEVATAMAFSCFQRAGVQIAVVETGMGGRLDATNIVLPLISVITRIAMDHEAYLGDTIEAIAAEKAGIIKQGRPLVAGPQDPEAEHILRKTAIDRNALFIDAARTVSVKRLDQTAEGQKVLIETAGGWSGSIHMPLHGSYQLENLMTTLAALEEIFSLLEINIPFPVIRKGIANVQWRGRFEILRQNPMVIADAAHNPSGAKALADTLKSLHIKRVALVTGMCADKDVRSVTRILAGTAGRVWTVPIPNPRFLAPAELAQSFRQAGVDALAHDHLRDALREAESWASDHNTAVVIAGSIFLLGEVLPCYP